MPSTFPCATCGTQLNNTNTFSYQKHMTQYHWPGKNNVFALSSIFTATFDDVYSPLYTTSSSDNAYSVYSGLGKRKRSTDDDSGSTPLRVRIDSPAGSTACSEVSLSGTSTPSPCLSSSTITPKIADFLASVGISPSSSQIGKRVYFTLVRR
jgi:hypothetical protein